MREGNQQEGKVTILQEQVEQREPRHLQLVSGVRDLCYAVEALEELLHRVKGDEVAAKESLEPPRKAAPPPLPSLSEVLSGLPAEIHEVANHISVIGKALEKLLF